MADVTRNRITQVTVTFKVTVTSRNTMTIHRIGEAQAKPELTEALRDFRLSIMPLIKSSQGCESVGTYYGRVHQD